MINQVYHVVQQLLNKNGYGLLTPTRFVYFAGASQLEVIEEVLGDYRIKKRDAARHDSVDELSLYDAIIELFADNQLLSREDESDVVQKYHIMPDDYMRWNHANVDGVDITKVPARGKATFNKSYFLAPSTSAPVCYIEGQKLYVLPDSIGIISDSGTPVAYDEVELHYYRYPKTPNWTFTMVGDTPVFNPDSSLYQDFEVPQSLFNRLVVSILKMSGLHIRDESVIQTAYNEAQEDFQKRNR